MANIECFQKCSKFTSLKCLSEIRSSQAFEVRLAQIPDLVRNHSNYSREQMTSEYKTEHKHIFKHKSDVNRELSSQYRFRKFQDEGICNG